MINFMLNYIFPYKDKIEICVSYSTVTVVYPDSRIPLNVQIFLLCGC